LELLTDQGHLREKDYLWLTDHARRPIEFADGAIEVLPWPTRTHQRLLKSLLRLFREIIEPAGCIVLFAPLRLRLRAATFREPDLLLLDATDPRNGERYWTGADLVVEIVSADNPERDLVEKRREYAAAGIPEYWIVNPLDHTVTILALDGDSYHEHGHFTPGTTATSALVPRSPSRSLSFSRHSVGKLAGASRSDNDEAGGIRIQKPSDRAVVPIEARRDTLPALAGG
jgi:Uma2 family endonuclease